MGFFAILLIMLGTALAVHYINTGHLVDPARFHGLAELAQPLLEQVTAVWTEPSKPLRSDPQSGTPATSAPAARSASPASSSSLDPKDLAEENDETDPIAETKASTNLELSTTEQVSALLDLADRQMAKLNYIQPEGDNALASYQEALQLDPGNKDALLGIKRIKSSLVFLADSARARGEPSKVHFYLKSALTVDPDDAALRERLSEMEQQPDRTADESSFSPSAL